MTRAHRRRHALTWALLGPATLVLLAIALFGCAPAVDVTAPPTTGVTP